MTFINRQGRVRTLLIMLTAVIAAGALCGTVFAQTRSKRPTAAVYIMGNPREREVMAMSVWSFLENSGKFDMIDIDAIDLLVKELKRQEDVSTVKIAEYGKNAGAEWVCVVQLSELDRVRYISTRMVDVENKIGRGSKVADLPRDANLLEFLQKQIQAMLSNVWGGGSLAPSQSSGGGGPAPNTFT